MITPLPTSTEQELELSSYLARACYSGDLPQCQHWLEAGANVNGVLPQGYTPKLTLKSSAHIPAVNRGAYMHGRSPLMIASERGHPEIVELLIKLGASPLQTNAQGLAPLHFAALARNDRAEQTLSALLSAGALIDARCHFSDSALDVAVYSYTPKPEAVSFLLSRGASIIGVNMYAEADTIEHYASPEFIPGTSWSMDPSIRAMIQAAREKLALGKTVAKAPSREPRFI